MKSKIIIIACFVCVLFSSCDGDFLYRPPVTSITEESFWKTTQDLETYINQYYTLFPGYGGYDIGAYGRDVNSDNLIPQSYNTRLAGLSITPTSGSSLSYGNIRGINYFLEKAEALQVSETQVAEKTALLGEGYYFRAHVYWDLLQNYGGVPWIDKVLTTTSPELYAPRETRNVIADHILADLDKAIDYLRPANTAVPFRLNKEIALAFKSRVALFEGTWEKYHKGSPFEAPVDNSRKYLEQAAAAAKDIIDGKYGTGYAIYSTGNKDMDYFTLFNQTDLQSNNEIIFWKKYSTALQTGHNGQRHCGIIAWGIGVSKSMVDSYLCTNGRPISNSDGYYKGDDLPFDIYTNRDPRLKQLVFVKDDPITIESNDTIAKFTVGGIHLSGETFCPTGYQIKKGSNPDNNNRVQRTDFSSETATILFRYGEVLLNYAEAKAELEELTQNDIDMSINKIRDRVDMAHLNMANIITDPDWDFPQLSPIINEIRRERRNELACEGFRFNDLIRWRAHHLITDQVPLGIKFNQDDYPSLVVGQSIYLTPEGFVIPYATILPNGWGFKPERDYLSPLTLQELGLNENLVQNPGWDSP